jgi:rSAM/selenodomain-associated transferase 2/rSAM/selenodomain-associated transferase 1
MPACDRLIVFTRYPEPGRNKTRLIPALGAVGAARLHDRMVRHTLNWAERLVASQPIDLQIQFTGADETAMAECFGSQFVYVSQCEGDLGHRLERAFHESFAGGACRVVVVGTDCPGLSEEVVRHAFDHLRDHDFVIGPAADGGYYLIGLARHAASLFCNIAWSTDQVLEQTLAAAIEADLSIAVLPTLEDVDRPEDLERWEQAQATTDRSSKATMTVVIPTLNEEPLLESTIESAASNNDTERIIVAAGRFQESLRLAVKHRCRFLTSPPGRAQQMNTGARAPSTAVLLFLHADTRLPTGFKAAVDSALSKHGIVAGAFSLKIDTHGWKYRLIEWGIARRSRWCQMPYGDQALFLARHTFERLGGFCNLPIMEDFDFVRRLRRIGQIAISPLPVRTSARRWQELGPLRTTCINQMMILGYYLGLPCTRLANLVSSPKSDLSRERRSAAR